MYIYYVLLFGYMIMSLIDTHFKCYILKVLDNKIYINDNGVQPDKWLIQSINKVSNTLFYHVEFNEKKYYYHNIPTGINQTVLIILESIDYDILKNDNLFSHTMVNILLQRVQLVNFRLTEFKYKNTYSCEKILTNMKNVFKTIFAPKFVDFSLLDYVYIRLIAANCTNVDIGCIIHKSPRTVEDKIKLLYKKLKCESRRELTEICNYVIINNLNTSVL